MRDTAIYLPHLLRAARDGLSDRTAGQREKPGKPHRITRVSSGRMERIVDPLTDALFSIPAPQVILSQSQDKALRRIGELREVGPTVSFVTPHQHLMFRLLIKEELLSKMYYKYRRERDANVNIIITQLRENICSKIQLLFINVMSPNGLKAPLALQPGFSSTGRFISSQQNRNPADRHSVLIRGLLFWYCTILVLVTVQRTNSFFKHLIAGLT